MTWDSLDFDSPQSESGVVHESVGNTDHNSDSILKQGYAIQNPYLSANLIAYWPLQEDSGGVAYDFGGSFNGTVNGATQNAPGLLGGSAYDFSGIGTADEVAIGDIGDPQQFTFTFWVNPRSLDINANNNYRSIIFSGTNFILIEQAARLSFRVPGVNTTNWTSGNIPLNTWTHCACVYNQSDRIIYLNGVESRRNTIGGGTVSLGSLTLGRTSTNTSQTLDGLLCDVRAYNKALSASEVSTLYNVVRTQGTLKTPKKVA